MKADLSELFDNPGRAQDFSKDLRRGSARDRQPEGPVRSRRARAEPCGDRQHFAIRRISLCARYSDRCLTPLSRPQHLEFTHTAVLSLNREDNDEYIVVSDGSLIWQSWLPPIFSSNSHLGLVRRKLQGLCPVCGANLNEGDCGCDRSQRDPRLDKLRELLDE